MGGHAMAIRDSVPKGSVLKRSSSMASQVSSSEILDKEFGKNDNQGAESQTWRNREIDWYNAERRFLFSAPTRAEAEHWFKVFAGHAAKPIREKQREHKPKIIAL